MTPTHFKTFRLGRTPPHVCVANKPPLGKEPGWEWNKKNHGMHKARSLDELQSNMETNYGTPTGKTNNIIVVDLDFYRRACAQRPWQVLLEHPKIRRSGRPAAAS